MQAIWNWLKGKKTYALTVIGGVLLTLMALGVPVPEFIWGALGIGTIAAFRHAVDQVEGKVDEVEETVDHIDGTVTHIEHDRAMNQ